MRTRTLVIVFLGLLLAVLCRLASAQSVDVSAELVDGSFNAIPGAYLHFDLYNCGPNYPQVMLSSPTSVVASGSPVTTITATIAGAGSSFHVGDTIVEAGNSYAPFNGTFTVTANGTNSVSWSLSSNTSPESGTGGILIDQTTGGYVVVQRSFDLQQNSSGIVNGSVLPNDLILCGGKVSTQWTVTPMKSGATPLNAAQRYFICSAIASGSPPCAQATPGGVFYLAVAQPAQTVPQPPGYSLIYANPTATQSIDQPVNTQFNWGGVVNFCSATVLCAGGSGTEAGGANTQVQYNCGGILCGASTFTYGAANGTLSSAVAGIYTNTQMNPSLSSLLGGINLTNVYQYAHGGIGGGDFATDAFAAGVLIPSTATATQVDAVAGYIDNHCAGAGLHCNGVAGAFTSQNSVSNAASWGINPLCTDVAGTTATWCLHEFDINVFGSPAYLSWFQANGVGSGGTMPGACTPTSGFFCDSVFDVIGQAFSSSGLLHSTGLVFRTKSIIPNGNAIWIGASCLTGSCPSPNIAMTGYDGTTAHTSSINVTSAGVMQLNNSPICTTANAACTGSGVTGSGTTNFFPLWTSSTALGNSVLTNVTSPNGINYSLGGGQYWQIDSSHLSWNASGSSNVTIANIFNPGGGNNAGGIILQGAPTSGSACAGPAIVEGGQNGSSSAQATLTVGGGCANGFGAIGESASIVTGTGTGGNGNGQFTVNDQTTTLTKANGGTAEAGFMKAASFQAGGSTFTASGCSNGTLVGGATAGKMTLGANSCSVTITMGSSQTAAHGWSCGANDQTTAAGNTQLYFTTGGSTTTAVLSVPATAGTTDVIDFRCTAY